MMSNDVPLSSLRDDLLRVLDSLTKSLQERVESLYDNLQFNSNDHFLLRVTATYAIQKEIPIFAMSASLMVDVSIDVTRREEHLHLSVDISKGDGLILSSFTSTCGYDYNRGDFICFPVDNFVKNVAMFLEENSSLIHQNL